MITSFPNDKSLAGTIVLEQGTEFLSKQIVMHMWIYGVQRFKKPLPYSHAETLLWNPEENRLVTSGARAENSRAIPVDDYYNKGHKILPLVPIVKLTDAEILKQWEYYQKIKDNKYQVGNFLAWITFMKTAVWISTKGDKLLYCYELAGRYADVIGNWKGHLDRVSVYDLYYNPYYRELREIDLAVISRQGLQGRH